MARRSRIPKRPRLSPLRYPGGKSALYPRLQYYIRSRRLSEGVYVEPYAGGAGAAISLLVTGEVARIVINDLDPAIAAFWSFLVEDPDEMSKRVAETPLTVEEWRRQKEIHSAGPSAASRDELGFATFYLNRTNRSGVLNGGPIGGLDQSGPYKIDARFNREALLERLRLVGVHASRITVSCRDGAEVIADYVCRDDALIYADPPYFDKAGSLYMNSFGASEHERLAAVLNNAADARWLLTYDDHPRVRELYPERRLRLLSLNYSARRVMRATEVAVFSDGFGEIDAGWAYDHSADGSGRSQVDDAAALQRPAAG
ncbi:DNA adenine methylase [Miltoncostaea marina]|uniref:DNA adenine methylase n=1 Tax=Miltoncostaea marina TaxID=2843215 RepID=UPI001FEA46D9|nr:DNA adenine methylase [Miltoncostaea marina]